MTPRRGLIWPLILIAIGVVFLLANFGYLAPISVVALFSLWPLILILIGIDIAVARRWPLAALVADVAIVAGGIALVATNTVAPGFVPFVIGGSNEPGVAMVDVPRSDAKTMNLRLSAGAGTYTLKGGTSASSLVHADSDREDLRLRSATQSGDRMDVRIDQGLGASGFRFGPSTASHVTVTVANDIPTSLRVDAGAGDFVVDTSDVKITDATISVGAASLHIVLPHPTGDVTISVSAGASSITLQVPDGVEARITTTGGLTSTNFDDPRFKGTETSGYAAAKDRVTVKISAGASSIGIVR